MDERGTASRDECLRSRGLVSCDQARVPVRAQRDLQSSRHLVALRAQDVGWQSFKGAAEILVCPLRRQVALRFSIYLQLRIFLRNSVQNSRISAAIFVGFGEKSCGILRYAAGRAFAAINPGSLIRPSGCRTKSSARTAFTICWCAAIDRRFDRRLETPSNPRRPLQSCRHDWAEFEDGCRPEIDRTQSAIRRSLLPDPIPG